VPRVSDYQQPRRVPGVDLQATEDGFIFYEADKDRVHFLNHTAVLILELSDGDTPPVEIAELVRKAYDLEEPPLQEVEETIARLLDEGLLQS
jgi:hypothetical protein